MTTLRRVFTQEILIAVYDDVDCKVASGGVTPQRFIGFTEEDGDMLDLWILTHPELRDVARVATVYAFFRDEIRKMKGVFDGRES